MENSRIFQAKGPFTLREISTETQSKLNDLCDADISVHDIFPLNDSRVYLPESSAHLGVVINIVVDCLFFD